jgi:hypothetical protein
MAKEIRAENYCAGTGAAMMQCGLFECIGPTHNRQPKPPSPHSVGGRVAALVSDGVWRTLWEIQTEIGGGAAQTAISARLRDLRKIGWKVEGRQRHGAKVGVWEYRGTP